MGTTFVEFVLMVASALREVGVWAHERSAKSMVFSWFWHALVILPGIVVTVRWPWSAGGVFFAYREGEQAFFAMLNKQPQPWADRVGDVLVPLAFGWLLFGPGRVIAGLGS